MLGFDADGEQLTFEATGWFARVMQHEFDHLNGLLYVDRLDPKQLKRARKAIRANGWGKAGTHGCPASTATRSATTTNRTSTRPRLDATGHDDRLA